MDGPSHEKSADSLKPMWTPFRNLALGLVVGVVAAIIATLLTHDLRDGGTLVAIPVGIVAWFVGDIVRWRGRFPMRLFLMVPIFVAVLCTVSLRFLQKANQRRVAWNSIVELGGSVKFSPERVSGWVQFEEGVFFPEFLETWGGSEIFASHADVSVPFRELGSHVGAEGNGIRSLNFDQVPPFTLTLESGGGHPSKIDRETLSTLANSNKVEWLQVVLFEPDEDTIQSLQVIRRPYNLLLSGVLSKKAMRFFSIDSPVRYLRISLSDPPDQSSWLDFLPSNPDCIIDLDGTITPANIQSIDAERPLGKITLHSTTVDDRTIQELATRSGVSRMAIRFAKEPSEAAIQSLCQSSISGEFGPCNISEQSIQYLVENQTRQWLSLRVSSIDSNSFRKLGSIKSLRQLELGFTLRKEDIQTMASFPDEIELSIGYGTNRDQLFEVERAIRIRKAVNRLEP